MTLDAWMMLGIGVVLGAVAVAVVFLIRQSPEAARNANVQARCGLLEEQASRLTREVDETRQRTSDAEARREAAERQAAVLDQRLKVEQASLVEQKQLLADAEKKLTDVFKSLGADVLRQNSDQFLKQAEERLKPFRELLDKQGTTLTEIERKRAEDKGGIEKLLAAIAQSHEKLNAETGRLVTALRRPEQRGRWGEVQLRNVVELAGMAEHCDFCEQVSVDSDDGRSRPDLVVSLPGGGVIVVDAKCALDAYLDALDPQRDRTDCLARHASQVERHFRGLAAKEYWRQFERTPKVVVMFVPLESALTAALEMKPDLHADAMSSHVLIATPTLLVALLRAVAYGWRQEDVASNARQIADAGRELYDRLARFVSSFESIGDALGTATKRYNTAIGSLESRLLPGARKLKELHATTEAEIKTPEPVEHEPREIVVQELKALALHSMRRDDDAA